MHRLRNSFLLLALVAASLAQTGTTPLANADVRRIGEKLRCMCGGCNYTVTSCNMLRCHGVEPMREKLLALVEKGMKENAILDEFAKEYGRIVLMSPPSDGFNLLAWVMPFVAIAAGLAAVWWFIQRFRKPLAVPVPQADQATLARYQDRIEKDLAKLDS
jgi:cytochrome c-type biogenesis protein CcmH